MARITLDLPESFIFSTELTVTIGDINYGGHMGNDAVLRLIHEARLRMLKSRGFRTEIEIGGFGLIITDAAIVYKSEAFHGDRLLAEVALADWNKYGCDFLYRLSNLDASVEVARAKTGVVFFDYGVRKVSRVPEVFKQAFNVPVAV